MLTNYPQKSHKRYSKINGAIGFTAILNGSNEELQKIEDATNRTLKNFEDISQITITHGFTTIILWGRGMLSECYQQQQDGSILILVGNPIGNYPWEMIAEKISAGLGTDDFEIPWEGRVILLRIDAEGKGWTAWNDWLGSIPIFHSKTSFGCITSTLEPIVVDVCGFSSNDISHTAVLSLLLWGNYFCDRTLFTGMKVLPPDCEATWNENGFHFRQKFSVKPSEDRWQVGWDDLLDEMYSLSKAAITNALKTNDRWILPLSSGLDSRLIAGVAAEIGVDVRAYTWGIPKTSDVIHAKSIAQALDIPWQFLDSGDTYLTDCRDRWSSLFGSAMHFHGMYQIPFLEKLPSYPILSGFIGECLAGYDVKMLCDVNSSLTPFTILPNGFLHWSVTELRDLVNFRIDDHLSEIAAEIDQLRESVPGALFQQLRYLILWGRQRHFTYFQSMMSDYWNGVTTPYMDREYARFSFSLPRVVLDDRILQQAMFRRYYAKLAAIPGTYARDPALITGSYLLKKRISNHLPDPIPKSLFPGLFRTKPNSDVQCVIKDGKRAFYPVFEKIDILNNWINTDITEKTYHKIINEKDGNAVRKLQSIQTLAFRFAN